MPEVLGAGDTLRRRMFPAVPEEEGTLFGTQITRSSAIDVGHLVAEPLDGIVGRDHLRASRASPLDHVCLYRQPGEHLIALTSWRSSTTRSPRLTTHRRPGSFAACWINVDGSSAESSAPPSPAAAARSRWASHRGATPPPPPAAPRFCQNG